jgi:hypothetical protein
VNALEYYNQRLAGKQAPTLAAFQALVQKAGVRPQFAVTEPNGGAPVGVEIYTFRNGGVDVVGLLTDPLLRVNELGPPEFRSAAPFEKAHPVRLALATELYVYDLRTAKSLGRKKELSLTLDPYEPTLLAFSAAPLPALQLAAPGRVARGEMASLALRLAGATPAAVHAIHIDVIDPDGKPALQYSGNLLARNGAAGRVLPFAQSDKPGKWLIRARDILGGGTAEAAVELY